MARSPFLQSVEDFMRVHRYSRRTISSYLYWIKLGQPVGDLTGFRRLERQRKLPVVLTEAEVSALLAAVGKPHYLKVALLYRSGLRRIELVRLRVKDIDFDYRQVRVINGKGGRHRLVTLADELLSALREQVGRVERFLSRDREAEQYAGVWLPDALARKYPSAPFELGWHYLFPASRLSVDRGSGCLADIVF